MPDCTLARGPGRLPGPPGPSTTSSGPSSRTRPSATPGSPRAGRMVRLSTAGTRHGLAGLAHHVGSRGGWSATERRPGAAWPTGDGPPRQARGTAAPRARAGWPSCLSGVVLVGLTVTPAEPSAQPPRRGPPWWWRRCRTGTSGRACPVVLDHRQDGQRGVAVDVRDERFRRRSTAVPSRRRAAPSRRHLAACALAGCPSCPASRTSRGGKWSYRIRWRRMLHDPGLHAGAGGRHRRPGGAARRTPGSTSTTRTCTRRPAGVHAHS